MLHEIEYYYQKSRESGIASMACPINTYLRNPISGKVQHWPDVHNYYEYINKCYSIAQEFPVEELWKEYHEARTQSKSALEKVHIKVIDALNELNEKDLNHLMGYTPISHVREQLIYLYNRIDASIRTYKPIAQASSSRVVPVTRKSIFARIFG